MNEYSVLVPHKDYASGYTSVKVWADNFVVGDNSLNFMCHGGVTQAFNHRDGWANVELVKR